jgi:DNA-binding NarL/FixJ family response regulator
MTLRVAVADDDADYRLLLRLALAADPDVLVVGEAASVEELHALFATTLVDLLLLDRSLPGGVAAVPELRLRHPDLRVALTSSLPASHVAQVVTEVGAVGSLAKDVPVRLLGGAIRELGALVGAAERALRTTRRGLPNTSDSVRASRHMTHGTLGRWCDPSVHETALLLISELVTNSVRHGDSDVFVRIAVGSETIRVEVNDRSTALPVVRSPAPSEPGGRGLRIVDQLARRWGVQARRTGKCVWFELARTPEAAAVP